MSSTEHAEGNRMNDAMASELLSCAKAIVCALPGPVHAFSIISTSCVLTLLRRYSVAVADIRILFTWLVRKFASLAVVVWKKSEMDLDTAERLCSIICDLNLLMVFQMRKGFQGTLLNLKREFLIDWTIILRDVTLPYILANNDVASLTSNFYLARR
jgi:hypothetical protein